MRIQLISFSCLLFGIRMWSFVRVRREVYSRFSMDKSVQFAGLSTDQKQKRTNVVRLAFSPAKFVGLLIQDGVQE